MKLQAMKLSKVPLEQILANLGAVFCLAITILVWRAVSAYQGMWPVPGLYFIEIVAICACAAGWLLSERAASRAVLWISAGIVLAFSLLAALSVGLYYFPVAVLLVIAALVADMRAGKSMLVHVGLFFAAGIIQAAVILAVANLLNN
jgi:hypothetical protein